MMAPKMLLLLVMLTRRAMEVNEKLQESAEFLELRDQRKVQMLQKENQNIYREENTKIESEAPLMLQPRESRKRIINKMLNTKPIVLAIALFLDVKDFTSFYELTYSTSKTLRLYLEFNMLNVSEGFISHFKYENLLSRIWPNPVHKAPVSLILYSKHVMKKQNDHIPCLVNLVGACALFGLMTFLLLVLAWIEIFSGSVSYNLFHYTYSAFVVFGDYLFYVISKIVLLQMHVTTKVLAGGIRVRIMRRQKENLKKLMDMFYFKHAIDSKTAISGLGTFSVISLVWIEMFHVSFSDWLFRFMYSAFVVYWDFLFYLILNIVAKSILYITAKLAISCVLCISVIACLITFIDSFKNIFLFRNVSGSMKFPVFQPINIPVDFFNILPASTLKTVPAFVSSFDAIYWFRTADEVFVFEKLSFEENEMRLTYYSKWATVEALYNINIPANPNLTNVILYKTITATGQNFNNFENINGFREPFIVQICIKKI